MDASFNQDQVNSNIDSAVLNDDNHNTVDKKWSMRNFIFCPFSIDLWDIQDLTLKIDDDIEENKLRYSSQTLSRLSQLNNLTILISKESPEQVVNTLLGGISMLINLQNLSIQFQLKQSFNNYYYFEDINYGQSHFFQGISKLIGLKKLNLPLSQQNDATVNKLLDSVVLLPNLVYFQLDLGALYLKNGMTYVKIIHLLKLNQVFNLNYFQQSNLVFSVQLESGKTFTIDLSKLELLTHLSLICDQYALTYLDLRTLASVLSTLRNQEYLELEIRTSKDLEANDGQRNPFIRSGSFSNLMKLKSLKITFLSQLHSNVEMQKWIYEAIPQLKNLSQLTFNFKDLFWVEKERPTILEQSLAKLVNLEKLNLILSHSKITEFQITILTSITSAIFHHATLSSLRLQLNCLSFKKSMVFFASQKQEVSSNLKELDLNLVNCEVIKNEGQQLPIGIYLLTNLISLTFKVTHCYLNKNIIKQILFEVTQLPSLSILSIDMITLISQRQMLLKKCRNLVAIRVKKA